MATLALSMAASCTGRVVPPAGTASAQTNETTPTSTSTSTTSTSTSTSTPPGTAEIAYATSRLTNAQYLNTVHDLFPGATFADPVLPNENVVDNFTNAASGQTATSLLIEDFQTAAESIATGIAGSFSAVVPCQPASTAAEDTCAQSFIGDFGKRAYRRPLTTDESTRFFAFYKGQRATDDFQTSILSTVQVFLQSPMFLYRLETGSGTSAGNLIPLTPYEIASRLSYFFIDSMPDAPLFQAADQNALTDPSQVEAQARRLMMDPRARTAVASFNYQWLQFVKMEGMTKDGTVFPSFTADVAQALHDSTVRFVDHAFWDLNSLGAMLTDSHAYVNDALAPYFGVSPPGSSELQLVSVDPTQRAGILTQPGLLAALAGPVDDSPVKRGVLTLSSFICAAPPPPPAGVNTNPPAFDPSVPTTTRERMEKQHALGSCAACHNLIDGIGFAFENYDAVGVWRTKENGLPVDASATITETDVDGTVVGGVAMANQLSRSTRVAQCVAYNWLRYALGLDTTQINLAAAQPVGETFSTSGGSFTDLLVAIARSDYFRSLKVSN